VPKRLKEAKPLRDAPPRATARVKREREARGEVRERTNVLFSYQRSDLPDKKSSMVDSHTTNYAKPPKIIFHTPKLIFEPI
jgi:hypothetical protein